MVHLKTAFNKTTKMARLLNMMRVEVETQMVPNLMLKSIFTNVEFKQQIEYN